MSSKVSFVFLPSLVVLRLLALFLFGIVLLVLLTVPRLGGCRLLVMWTAWLLLILILLVIVGMRLLVWEFLGVVDLVLYGKDFD